ncbi:hypothetical protein ACFL4D_03375, partial [Candidatus Margulisiibacteriota bacterium]
MTNMAIFEYCENAKQYHVYFKGITPFMKLKDAVRNIYMNIYWIHHGNRKNIDHVIKKMAYDLTLTTSSCVKRLGTMCKNDAFMNAYARTQSASLILSFHDSETLENYLKEETV